MDFSSLIDDRDRDSGPWGGERQIARRTKPINLAPLKGALESDPVRAKVIRLLIEDGGWVSTADLLNAARKVRAMVGAVTIGTILTGLNELVASKLILSRTSLTSGLDWAEWRINPEWLEPTRKLLQMLTRAKLYSSRETDLHERVQRILDSQE